MMRAKLAVAFFGIAILAILHPVICAASVEGSFQRTLTVNGAVDLDISTGSGNITVQTGGAGTVKVTGYIKASGWFDSGAQEKVRRLEANPPIQQSANSIRIGHIQEHALQENISISYEVVVPAETRLKAHSGSGAQTIDGIGGPLEVDAGSGAVKISNIGSTVRAETGSGNMDIDHVRGNVRAHAGSGSIRATDIHGGFEGNTGSGRITLSQTAPGAVRVETGSGGMELKGVRGTLEARAGSGGITAEGEPTGGWMVHSGSGSIHLRLPSDAAFDLDARTSSGSISLDHPVTVQGTMGRKEVRGKVRGGGVTVQVETGSGNIEIL
jgi:DUF4097 and DUF4098 domain-containing protein YvlB